MAVSVLSFSQWAISNRLAFAVLVDPQNDGDHYVASANITRRSLLLFNEAARTHYLEGDDLNVLLWSASRWGYDYLWVQRPGNYIINKVAIQDAISDEIRRGFFLLGNIVGHSDNNRLV